MNLYDVKHLQSYTLAGQILRLRGLKAALLRMKGPEGTTTSGLYRAS